MEQEKPNNNRLIQWIKKDYVIIIICLLCLLGCMYTLLTVGEYQQIINEHWEEQLEHCTCEQAPILSNTNFSFLMDYEEVQNNGNQN